MGKSLTPFALGIALLTIAAPVASAAPRSTGGCIAGKPSVLVRIDGFKQVAGQVKVSLYGPDGDRWLAKGGKVAKVKVPVRAKSMDVCIPTPSTGRYAVAVHHDFNVNGKRDRSDGGGYSRDPKVSLLNPKPAFSRASFRVGNGPTRVGVTLLYIKGLGVGPAAS